MNVRNIILEMQAERIRYEAGKLIAKFILEYNNIEYEDCLKDFMSLPKEYQKKLINDFNEKFEVHVDHIIDMNSRLEKFEIRIDRKEDA